ncbi:DUF6452 family protein [Gramella sp. KN1008]|uniref:DUF6452 family protein n=1 Tax=Gramella sp. KN1008 TaxID=2529298 RepID=UPI00103D1594|nr:DUF6452 family protein [Gramella sp. KN1008]TBW25746.1 hypothetical protein EZJ28_15150 [Gramella sp. KN1008]
MKSYTYKFLLISFLLVGFACQRDDICPESTETTPLLIIRFYDNEAPEELQAPQNLRVRSVGNDTSYVYNRYSQDSIAIPLRTDQDITEYIFTLNTPADPQEGEEPDEPGNSDILTISYGREEEYLNRACAYKVNYVGLNVDVENDDDNWIQDIQIERPNVEDQNQAHVSIFF